MKVPSGETRLDAAHGMSLVALVVVVATALHVAGVNIPLGEVTLWTNVVEVHLRSGAVLPPNLPPGVEATRLGMEVAVPNDMTDALLRAGGALPGAVFLLMAVLLIRHLVLALHDRGSFTGAEVTRARRVTSLMVLSPLAVFASAVTDMARVYRAGLGDLVVVSLDMTMVMATAGAAAVFMALVLTLVADRELRRDVEDPV